MATSKVIFTEEVVKIPTYKEGKTENLPMFAENRVHQRTSGNPFPNKVVLETYLGQTKDATELMQNFLASDEKELTKTDMGHFGTTPFFISFIDRPATDRENYFAYRLFLTSKFLGDKERMEKYSKIVETDGYGMYIEDFTK